MIEVLHRERFEILILSSMRSLTIGLSRFPLNLSLSSQSQTSPSERMSQIVFIKILDISDTVEIDRYSIFDCDLI